MAYDLVVFYTDDNENQVASIRFDGIEEDLDSLKEKALAGFYKKRIKFLGKIDMTCVALAIFDEYGEMVWHHGKSREWILEELKRDEEE